MERTEAVREGKIPKPGRTEVLSLAVTAVLASLSLFFGLRSLAFGVGVGGVMLVGNFLAIRMVVSIIASGGQSRAFVIFVLLVKLLALIALVAALFAFARIDILGFMIGVLGVVLVILGDSLRSTGDGAL